MDRIIAGNPTSQLIVDTVESTGEMTRAAIADRLGLPISRVNAHVRTLLRRQVLVERDPGPSGGKGRTSLLLSSTAGVGVIAVISLRHGPELARGPVHVALVDVNGSIISLAVADPADHPVQTGLRLLEGDLTAHPAAARGLLCAVLSVPLPLQTDYSDDSAREPHLTVIATLADVIGASPQDQVSARLGVPTILRNDADLATLGEARWGAGRGDSALVYLKMITGLGMGIIRDGRLLTGDVTPGEIAHIRVPGAAKRCICGSIGCLWTIWGGRLVLQG